MNLFIHYVPSGYVNATCLEADKTKPPMSPCTAAH